MKKTETPPAQSFHDRLLAARMKDPEFRAEFEWANREIKSVDAIVNRLDFVADRSRRDEG